MKSKSPFSKKSPMKLQLYRGDTYESPDTVITKTVGEQVGAAITGLADNAVDYMDNYKKTKKPSETIASVGLGGGEYKGFGGGMKEINLPETPDVNTNLTDKGFGRFTQSNVNTSLTEVPDLVNKGKAERGVKTVNGKKVLTHEANADKLEYKKGTQERTDFINASTEYNKLKYKTDEPTKEGKAKNYITTEGSPSKLIGDTMDPYGQPQRGIRDFAFNENEIAPGTLGNQASMGVQKEIYGGGQAQAIASQAANSLRADKMDLIGNTDSMLAMKGFANTEGELIDETKFEELPKENTKGYNVQDVTSIKTDKKGQEYMVDIETKKDTIYPEQGNIKFPRLKSKNKGRTFNI